MNSKPIRIAAGVMSITGGIVQFGGIGYLIYNFIEILPRLGGGNPFQHAIVTSYFGIPLLIMGTLAILGGIFTLKNKRWKLALTGALVAYLPIWIIFILGGVSIELPYAVSAILTGILGMVIAVLSMNIKKLKPVLTGSLVAFLPLCVIAILVFSFPDLKSEYWLILLVYIAVLLLLVLTPALTYRSREESS